MSILSFYYHAMTNYGTWTTIDCHYRSTEIMNESYEFLVKEFEVIGGSVRKMHNTHDLGTYPSFEIDMPDDLKDIDEEDESDENIALLELKDKWVSEANDIERAYNTKFSEYL